MREMEEVYADDAALDEEELVVDEGSGTSGDWQDVVARAERTSGKGQGGDRRRDCDDGGLRSHRRQPQRRHDHRPHQTPSG